MGIWRSVPVPQQYRDAIERDIELPAGKRSLPVVPQQSELHPLWYLFEHRLTEWPDGLQKARRINEEIAANVQVKSRKVKFDDILDPYPNVSERHPYFLDYGEGKHSKHNDTTKYSFCADLIPVKSRKLKFDDTLEPAPKYSEVHPLRLDYGEGIPRSHDDRTVYQTPAERIAVKPRSVKFDDIIDPEPRYSEVHPLFLDYGEGILRSHNDQRFYNTPAEFIRVKSRWVKFEDILDPEPQYCERHPLLLDYGEGIFRKQVPNDYQTPPEPKWPRTVMFCSDAPPSSSEIHPFKLHFGHNYPLVKQIPVDPSHEPADYVHVPSITYLLEPCEEDSKTFEPVTGQIVHFSILRQFAPRHTDTMPMETVDEEEENLKVPERIGPRRSILKAYEPTRICVTASEKVLHDSLVLASHLFWALRYRTETYEDDDGEDATVSAMEFLTKMPVTRDELSPMSLAPNRDFLRNGCPTFSRLNKVPQIDFPAKLQRTGSAVDGLAEDDQMQDNVDVNDTDTTAIGTTGEEEKNVKVPESIYIDLEPHAHLKQSYFPQLKPSASHQRPIAIEHKVLLVMQAAGLTAGQVEEYLRDICNIKDVCKKDVRITALEHHGGKSTCKIVFPSGKAARRFKTQMDKIKQTSGCHAELFEEVKDVDIIRQNLADSMNLLLRESLNVLATHQAKQKDIDEKLKKTGSKKTKLAELDDILEERRVLQQKQQELKKQEEEYLLFVKIFQEQFRKITPSAHWKEEVEMLKKRYEVEKERLQSALPMYAKRSEIVKMIAENQVSILLGETGSGKSTQVTQYLYEAGLAGQKKIVCTQPRKVAATSLAKRVSTEMHSQLGDTVGYKVGMQKQMSKETRILYVTDHILLRECLDDPVLSKYSCVIIDEAHERSLNTDLLLGMIKKALVHRPDLRVIITSATINPDVFVAYFSGCPVLKVSGRVFPVEVVYSDKAADADRDFVQRAVEKAVDVALQREPGDILVFLTTPLETEKACEKLLKLWPNNKNELLCLALHGKTQSMDQQKVFGPTPRGKRKIVFATNSAETSVTIPGIKVVIDTGLVKEKTYDHRRNMSSLKVTNISQSSATQRKGRAGRTEKGKCYRLYREEDYESMDTSTKPEIMKVHLGMALLTLLSFNIEDPLSFDFVEMPPREGLEKAMDVLVYLEAVDKDGKLTPLGKKLAAMSLEPCMAKLVLNGIDRGIGFECVLVACFSTMGGNMFYRGGSESNKQQADKLKVRFCNLRGDIHTMLDVYKEWTKQPEKEKTRWCMDNSINAKSMKMARESVKEIQSTLESDLKIRVHQQFHKDKDTMERIMENVILESYAMNLCVFSGHESLGYMMVTDLDKLVHVHPSSALKPLAKSPRYMVYENTLTTSRAFVINVTCISDDVFERFCRKGNPPIDLDEIKRRVLGSDVISDVGTSIVRKICGPRHSTRVMLEKDLQVYFHTEMLALDAKVEAGTISVYALPDMRDDCYKLVKDVVVKEQECLYQEEIERPLLEGCAVRAIIGHGGKTKCLLFADEFRTIHIRSVPPQYDVEHLVEAFREVAVVTDYESYIIRKDDNRNGLKVTFEYPEAAEMVLQMLDSRGEDGRGESILPGIIAKPDLTGAKGLSLPPMQNVSLKITWCRRANKGLAFVKFARPGTAMAAVEHMSHVSVGSHLCPIKLSNKNNEELFVRNIPKMLPSHEVSKSIRDSIEEQTSCRAADVKVPNEPPHETSNSDCTQYKKCIEYYIEQNAPNTPGIEVNMRTPSNHAVQFVAFVNAKNALDGEVILEALTGMPIMGAPTQVHMTLKTFIIVRQEIVRYIKDELQSIMGDLEADIEGLNCRGDIMKNVAWGYRIDISGRTAADLTEARTRLARCIDGKRIDIEKVQHLLYFKNMKKGQQFMHKVQQRCYVNITIDQYLSVIILHGKQADVLKASAQILRHVDFLRNSGTKNYDLRELFPAGMTKRLMAVYGLDLQALVDESGVEMVNLQLRNHSLTVHGTLEAIANVDHALKTHALVLTEKAREKQELSLPDCPVCFCEVDSHEQYRLEYCGHAYCESCIKNLLEHGIRDKSFPIQCAQDGCDKDVVIKDIFALVGKSMDRLRPFITASVDCYAATHGDELQYCITHGCNMLYRANCGEVEVCGLCQVNICTLCHSEYHPSISCELNKQIKDKLNGRSFDEYSKESWLEEDPQNRAICPQCNTGIEKNGGCLHMSCKCGAHICWKCKGVFSSGPETYEHLGTCQGNN